MWVALCPFFIFALLTGALYCPPVQQFAVDKASEWLSEEMGMEVGVERVLLKFPLDLKLNGICAIQAPDTLLLADEAAVSVKLKPLFGSEVEIDDVHLYGVRLNTANLVEACQVKGGVGELVLSSHKTSLEAENAVVSHALLKDADVSVVLADSTKEDTTTSAPLNWKVDIRDVEIENVRASVDLGAAAGHQTASVYIGKGSLAGLLDLGKGRYQFSNLNLEQSSVGYERYTLDVSKFFTSLTVDTSRVQIDSLLLQTPDSRIVARGNMDFNAFDSVSPGQFSLLCDAYIGRDDIHNGISGFLPEKDAKELIATLDEYLPRRPIRAAVDCEGNLQHLNVSMLDAVIDRFAQLHSSMTMDLGKIAFRGDLASYGGKILVNALYDMNREAYNVGVSARRFDVNRFVSLPERCVLTGRVALKGNGFDMLAKSTSVDVKALVDQLHWGKIDVSTSKLNAHLQRGKLDADYSCNNQKLQTDVELNANIGNVIATAMGKNVKESMNGSIDVDLKMLDAEAMGFIDTMMVVSTRGTADFSAAKWNSKRPSFLLKSMIDGVTVLTSGGDSLRTEPFDLTAFTTPDSTDVRLATGDLTVDFESPLNVMDLSTKAGKFAAVVEQQQKKRMVDLQVLKEYMPTLCLKAQMGMENPVGPLARMYGIAFDDVNLDVDITPETGLVGDAHIYGLKYDSIYIDTIHADLAQDSSRIEYHSNVAALKRPEMPAFSAFLDGYLTMRQLDTHLQFFDGRKRKGIDIGLHGEFTDTALNVNLYPEMPIVAYHKFEMNRNNFIQLPVVDKYVDVTAPVLADIRLHSVDDSCRIELEGSATELGGQAARVLIDRLNMSSLMSVLPYMPNMAGFVDAKLDYTAEKDSMVVDGTLNLENFAYDEMVIGNFHSDFDYKPIGKDVHTVRGTLDYNKLLVADLDGKYVTTGGGYLDADLFLKDLPLSIASPFIPQKLATLTGNLVGQVNIQGPTDNLKYNGKVMNKGVHIISAPYSLDLSVADDTVFVAENKVTIKGLKLYGAGENPLTIRGNYDFADMDNVSMALTAYGRNVKLIESKRKRHSLLFGDVYGDIMFRLNGTMDDMTIRGMVNVLDKTNMTYILSDATISQGDRLEDIVTFTDFSLPPDTTVVRPKPMGLDMNISLNIEEGAKFNCEFSADRQSYVNVRGGGNLTMKYTPEGAFNVIGRVTVNEGEMKYTLPIIPLKTFTIGSGSYVEFNGDIMNPTLNVTATERTKAQVQSAGSTARSVDFEVGLKITNTLSKMGLLFTIDAPSDALVQAELARCTEEDKNKLAVAMLATGMYVSNNNTSTITASSALNSFLQKEINSITGKALSSIVDISMGIDQTTYANGQTGTDYSFKFSKRFFSDRLSVVIGGKVSDNKAVNQSSGVGSFINDVSLEWRLDNSATRYVRIFHTRDYENIVEGELDKNGAGIVLRKKVDKLTDLFIFKKKTTANNTPGQTGNTRRKESEGQPATEDRKEGTKL